MKKILYIVLLLCCAQSLSAQSAFKGDNGKYGFKDSSGNVIIPCEFTDVHPTLFNDGLCAVKKESKRNAKWGFIDLRGQLIIPYKYTAIYYGFSEGLCGVGWNGISKRGYINKSGKVIIKLDNFSIPYSFIGGIAKVITHKGPITIDKNGQECLTKTSTEDQVQEVRSFLASVQDQDTKSNKNTETVHQNQSIPDVISYSVTNDSDTSKEDKSVKNNAVEPALPQRKIHTGADVDHNIPQTSIKNENTFAVIIANENYKREATVDYALNDGEIFMRYCLHTLGLPKSNVHYVKDATLNDFRAEMDWLSMVSNAYSGEARLIVYYAGHGVPDEKTQSSYLLPIDGYGSNVNTGYKLSDMYKTLSTYPVKSVVVLLDACFSGAQRNGDMLASARGVALKAKPEAPKGNMVVMTAASGDETAYKYDEKNHGMFTYFLLKKLQEKGADTTLGELADFITTNVGRKSIVVNLKPQTPTVSASGTLSSEWKTITFKE